MMRTNKIIALAVLMPLLNACTGEEPAIQEYGTIHFSLEDCAGARSSTSSEAYEDAINSLQVIVADNDGHIECCREFSGSGEFDIPAKPGDKMVLAIANGPSLAACSTIEEARNTEIDLRQWNNEVNGLVMSGEKQCRVAVDSISDLPVILVRYVSRVNFAKVVNKMPAEYGNLMINGIWLSNAAGNQIISGNPQVQELLSGMDDARISHSHSILGEWVSKSLLQNVSYLPNTRMYCYPNCSGTCTTAVLAAEIQGKEYFYPIRLPILERNTDYDVELSVYHPGSTDPGTPVCPGYIKVDVWASLWTEGPEINENL